MITRRSPRSFDEEFYDGLTVGATRAMQRGMSLEEAVELVMQAADPALNNLANSVTARLHKTRPRMLRDHRRINRRFERHLRTCWADGLDQFYAVTVGGEELGRAFDEARAEQAVAQQDWLFESLTQLHARACRTAFEVHQMLSGGYPMGALARCRTLHELAVTAAVLSENGRTPIHADIGERYLAHDAVLNWRDALEFQKHAKRLGEDPFTDDEMTEMKSRRDAVVARFGAGFADSYGWASLCEH